MSTIVRLAGFWALMGLASGVSAQGWVAGGAIGDASQQDYSVGGPIATSDDSDSASRLFGGYMFGPFHGVVASYVDLGTPYYDGPAWGGFTDYLSADGIDVSYVIGWAPGMEERVSVFGTVGFFDWTQDVTYTDPSGVYIYNDDGTSLSFGIGSEVRFGGAWGFHFQWQIFQDVGDEDNSGHEYDRETLWLGAEYRFGQ